MPRFAAIEFGKLFEVIWVSLVMGVGVTALFAIVIHGSHRATEARRSGTGSPVLHGAVATLALATFLAAVVFGLMVILRKD